MSKVRASLLATAILLFISIITALFIFGFYSPASATAEEGTEVVTHIHSDSAHADISGVTWRPLIERQAVIPDGVTFNNPYLLKGQSGVISESGAYYLCLHNQSSTAEDSITLDQLTPNGASKVTTITIASGTNVTLCLNGYYIDGGKLGTVITVETGATFTLCDCNSLPGRIRQGKGSRGGGVRVQSGATFIMNGGVIRASEGIRGGGVYVSGADTDKNLAGGTFIMNGGRIRKNITVNGKIGTEDANGNGAGVYIATGGTFTMTGGEIFQNQAAFSGGAIYVAWSTESTVTQGGKFVMTGGIISNNIAVNGGGIACNRGIVEITGGTIGGDVEGDAAIDENRDTDGAKNMGNVATNRGGAVYCVAGSVEIGGEAVIKRNRVTSTDTTDTGNVGGGGLFVIQRTYEEEVNGKKETKSEKGTLTMTGGTITENRSWRGGGVYVANGGELTVSGGKINGNFARYISASPVGTGGGVFIKGGTVNMSGGSISDNAADQSGGGVYAFTDGKFTMTGGTIGGNNAKCGNGGGVLINGGEAAMSGGTIGGADGGSLANTATAIGNTDADGKVTSYSYGNGGGVFVYDGTFAMSDTAAILGNRASTGGGVYVNDNCTFAIGGGTVGANAAVAIETGKDSDGNPTYYGGNGGGVLLGANAKLDMTSGSVGENTAERHGGGVYINSRATLTMTGGEISGNVAQTASGGGVCVGSSGDIGGSVVIDGGKIALNTANTGGGIASLGSVELISGEISGNTAVGNGGGGGVLMQRATLTVVGGVIGGNHATNGYGGGVYVWDTNSAVTITGGAIDGNDAKNGGGGIYSFGGAVVTVSDTAAISGNHAAYGGGVFLGDGEFAMSGGAISGNFATNGGGVYVSADSGEFTVSGGIISANKKSADNTENSNVFLVGSKTISVGEKIKAGTSIGITVPFNNKAYVFTSGYGGDYNKTDGAVVAPKQYFFGDKGECVRLTDGEASAGHDIKNYPATAADCVTDGNIEYWHCEYADCDKYFADSAYTSEIARQDTVIEQTGHHMASRSKDATCTEAGEKLHQYCDQCDKHFADGTPLVEISAADYVLPPSGHKYEVIKNVPPTCTEAGEKLSRCSVCGDETDESPAATGHDMKAVSKKSPTCTEPGYEAHYECNACHKKFKDADGNTETDPTIPETEHDYGEPQWTWSGYTSATALFTCKNNCGDKQQVTATVADGAIERTFHQDASCTDDGKNVYKATITFDGKQYSDEATEILDRFAHVWTAVWTWSKNASDEASVTVTFTCNATAGYPHSLLVTDGITVDPPIVTPADCQKTGAKVYAASVVFDGQTYSTSDAQKYTITIPIAEHSYTEEEVDLAPTCTTAGSKSMHCSVCGEIDEETVQSIPATGHSWTVTPVDGALKTYVAFDAFSLDGFAVSFTCANDPAHNETLTDAQEGPKVAYASGNCLHYGDDTVTVSATTRNYGAYSYTVTGITVKPRPAANVVWEYFADGEWKPLVDGASTVYDGVSHAVRVRFDKHVADDTDTSAYAIVFDDRFKDVKTEAYRYVLAEYGNYSIADSARNVTVTKAQVAAGGAEWLSGGAALMSGYVLRDGEQYKYYPSSVDGAVEVANGVVRYVSGAVTVAYNYTGTLYEASYANNTASCSSMNTATATLTLKDGNNYEFVVEDGAIGATLNADGSVTVTKVWYAAICGNGFTGGINGWVFGAAAPALPALEKDDATAPVVIGFTLKRNGASIGSAFGRGEYAYYINSSAPVGDYTLEAIVDAVTIGGVEYAGFAYTFTFEVTEATLSVSDLSALADISVTYDGDLHIHRDYAPTATLFTAREGVWAGSEYDGLYSVAASIAFCATSDGTFISADDMSNNADGDFINAGSYTAYYKISALNYADVTGGSFAVDIEKATYDLKDAVFNGKTETYSPDKAYTLDGMTGLPAGVSVAYTGNDEKTTANETGYVVTATLSFADKINYIFVNTADGDDRHIGDGGKTAVYTATLIIMKATYTIDVAFADDTVTFDGKPHSLAVVINTPLPAGVTVSYTGNAKTIVGEYTVTAKFTGDSVNYNPIPDKTALLSIKTQKVGLSLSFTDATYSYDGNTHSIELIGELPDTVEVSYANNSAFATGEYNATATVSLKDTHNYEFVDGTQTLYTAKLIITEVAVDMRDVRFESDSFVYTGKAYSLSITGKLPAGVTYSYENNSRTNAGSQTVTVHFYHNKPGYGPIEDMTAQLEIVKATYDINVTFPDATVVYTGKPHSLSIRGTLPAGVTYAYENNSLTNVGSRTVTVKFFGDDENYMPIPDKTAFLRVVPASLGVTDLALEGKTLAYDGNTHMLAVNGNIPNDVEVKYYVTVDGREVEFGGATEAGIYDVTAKFILPDSENFKAIRPLSAKLTITAPAAVENPPAIVEPSVAEIETPAISETDLDKQAKVVKGEIVRERDFDYRIVAVCIIAAEAIAMAVMGCYIAFVSHKRRKR